MPTYYWENVNGIKPVDRNILYPILPVFDITVRLWFYTKESL